MLAAIVGFSGYAFAQTPAPKSGKAVKQAKPVGAPQPRRSFWNWLWP